MRRHSGIQPLFLLTCLSACNAGWSRLVEYSTEPADQPVVVELYRAVLSPYTEKPWPGSIAVRPFGEGSPLEEPPSPPVIRIPGHWADTLKHEVRTALVDPDAAKVADRKQIERAARALGLVVLQDTTEWLVNSARPPAPVIRLSRPGFNLDSTIAAVRMDLWCGPICGADETVLLARRPGKRWRIWHSFLHVVR
jgi:hypothetical protein